MNPSLSKSALLSSATLAAILCTPAARANDLAEWKTCMDQAESDIKMSRPRKGLPLLEKALASLDPVAHARDEHPAEFEKTLKLLADGYRDIADYRREYRTLTLLRGLYRFQKRFDTLAYADCLWQLGSCCDHLGRYEEGLACLEAAASIYSGSGASSRQQEHRIARGLGHLYMAAGKLLEAKKSLAGSSRLAENLWNESAADLGRAFMLQAEAVLKSKEPEQACDFYRKSIEVLKSSHRRGHILIGQALAGYIDLLETELQSRDAYSDRAKMENVLTSLADACMLNGNHYRARTALAELRKHLEADGKSRLMRYGKCIYNQAQCSLLMDDSKGGLGFAREAEAFYQDVAGDHERAALSALLAARMAARLKDSDQYRTEMEKAEKAIVSIHGSNSREYGYCLAVKGLSLMRLGRTEEVRALLPAIVDAYELDEDPVCAGALAGKDSKTILDAVSRIEDDRQHERIWDEWQELDTRFLF